MGIWCSDPKEKSVHIVCECCGAKTFVKNIPTTANVSSIREDIIECLADHDYKWKETGGAGIEWNIAWAMCPACQHKALNHYIKECKDIW